VTHWWTRGDFLFLPRALSGHGPLATGRDPKRNINKRERRTALGLRLHKSEPLAVKQSPVAKFECGNHQQGHERKRHERCRQA
jgi:hypothetical protein